MLALVLVVFICPSVALANVEDYETALMTPEQLYQYEYEPDVKEVESTPVVRALPDEATTVDYVNSTLDSFNSVKVGSANMSWIDAVRAVLGNSASGSTHSGQLRALYIIPAIGICFMWWGVRKSIKVINKAWRKGKASL